MPVAAVLAVFAGVLGLAALLLMTYTAYEQVRSLGRTVARAAERLGAAAPPAMGQDRTDA